MGKDRITELEIKISYQDDLLQELNVIVSEQQKQIYRLEEAYRVLGERMKNMAEPEGIAQGVEVPPHY
ncbi:MAG: SlyX protein [Methylomarinum sp.]|nr:SlyX protein [Methylomarinum sp.]